MASYLWRKYADYVYTKWERTILWDMMEPYKKPKSFTPLVTIYIAAFYTGVIGSAITEQLYKVRFHHFPLQFSPQLFQSFDALFQFWLWLLELFA